MSSVYYYGLALLEGQRERVAGKLRTLSDAELEEIVKNRPVLDQDSIEPAALGLFGSEESPIIRTCAAYDLIKERRGELYAYSLFDNPNNYPVKNWKKTIGKGIAIAGLAGLIGCPALAINMQDQELGNLLMMMGFVSPILGPILGLGLYAKGHCQGIERLSREMEEKSPKYN